jgi:hypothetical protein
MTTVTAARSNARVGRVSMRFVVTTAAILLAASFVGCPRRGGGGGGGGGTVPIPVPTNFPTSGTICAPWGPFSYTSPATITSSSLPPWLTLSGSTLSGTPQGNDFGTFPVSVTGTYQGQTGTASSAITVAPPTSFTSAGGPFDILTLTSAVSTNTVTLTATPACTYTVTFTTVPWTGNRIVNPPPLTLTGGTGTFQISIETDVPGDGQVIAKIVPTGQGANPLSETIPVHAHK